jgi:hypothetical protein
MALAIIEHLVLVLPVSDTALWRWAMARQDRGNLAIRPVADGVSALKEGGPVSGPHTAWTTIGHDTIGKRKD